MPRKKSEHKMMEEKPKKEKISPITKKLVKLMRKGEPDIKGKALELVKDEYEKKKKSKMKRK